MTSEISLSNQPAVRTPDQIAKIIEDFFMGQDPRLHFCAGYLLKIPFEGLSMSINGSENSSRYGIFTISNQQALGKINAVPYNGKQKIHTNGGTGYTIIKTASSDLVELNLDPPVSSIEIQEYTYLTGVHLTDAVAQYHGNFYRKQPENKQEPPSSEGIVIPVTVFRTLVTRKNEQGEQIATDASNISYTIGHIDLSKLREKITNVSGLREIESLERISYLKNERYRFQGMIVEAESHKVRGNVTPLVLTLGPNSSLSGERQTSSETLFVIQKESGQYITATSSAYNNNYNFRQVNCEEFLVQTVRLYARRPGRGSHNLWEMIACKNVIVSQ
jgi:hypothetical protein